MKTTSISPFALALGVSLVALATNVPVDGKATRGQEVYAVWYEVPSGSTAKRRARTDELTAAHNHLPIGTLVRVTNVRNNKTVLVRITDRGVADKRAKIDICKAAAQQLDIIRQGIARVRLEILPDAAQSGGTESNRVTAH